MDEQNKSLLMIFYRNPKFGMVKTRLAADIGNHKALEIYQKLSRYTKTITQDLPMEKMVFYSDAIDLMDIWPNATYLKALQSRGDLGEKMSNAFTAAFEAGYSSICIIGTDCYELSGEIITEAFEELKSVNAVVGPAKDGGYYLLGMNRPYDVFKNKRWGTETVLEETINDFETLKLLYVKLEQLNDIDMEDDLPEELL